MKIKINKCTDLLCKYLLAIILILNCRSIWMNMVGIREWIANVLLLLMVICIITEIIIKKRVFRSMLYQTIQWIVMTDIYLLIFIILNPYNISQFIKLLIAVSAIMLYFGVCENEGFPKIFLAYSDVMLIVTAFSLVMWLLGPILGIVSPSETVYMNWSNMGEDVPVKSYYGIYFSTQGQLSVLNILTAIRNTAIFTEGPMCSFQISLAFLIELFCDKKRNNIRLFIFTVGIISTLSTTGYILILAAYMGRYIIDKPKQKFLYYIKICILPFGGILALGLSYILIESKLGTGSGNIRIDDFVVGFRAWSLKPILGAGYGNQEYIQSFMGSWRAFNNGFSNSVMTVLAQTGVYGGALYFIPIVLKVKDSLIKRRWNEFFLVCLMGYMIIFTVVTYNFITLFFVSWCFWSRNNTKSNHN